jgi:hypothetical protein
MLYNYNHGRQSAGGGILPMSGGGGNGISTSYPSAFDAMSFNDTSNPGIMYGPGGGPDALLAELPPMPDKFTRRQLRVSRDNRRTNRVVNGHVLLTG